jgi:multicomponent K+:H+ antiporter subunit A
MMTSDASPLTHAYLLPWLLALPFAGALLLAAGGRAVAALNTRALASAVAGGVAVLGLVFLWVLSGAAFDGVTARWSVAWLPSLGVTFGLRLDGLAYLFVLLVLAIGLLVVIYGACYLADEDPPARFFAFLLLFMGAMLGLVLADNLILLVVFWELTSISSFLLIGFWRHRADARQGARMALTITGMGGLALLAAVLLIGKVVGSYSLDVVLASRAVLQASPLFTPILLLVLLGAFSKSAQFPLHFWLPRAMAAPTPVSAYLHSATMVKAGVFLLARMYPALGGNELWFWVVSSVGLATLLFGAVVAIFQHDLKGLLAYSTISHLGLITLLFGLDTRLGVVAGVFHIINHAVFKASLFMAAGIIDHETGSRDMRQLNGLWSAMPVTATLAMVAAAAMAGVPLANGFLSKEMFFVEAVSMESHRLLEIATPIAATVAAIASVAYSLRFIHDVFFNGKPVGLTKTPHEPPRLMRIPVEFLVLLCLAVGMFPAVMVGPLLQLAAGAALGGALPEYKLAIWHGFNLPLLMSVIALTGGVAVYFTLQKRINLHTVAKLPGDAKELFDVAIENLRAVAGWVTRLTQNARLDWYLMAILGVAVLAGLFAYRAMPVVPLPDNLRVPQQSANPVVIALAGIGIAAAFAVVRWHAERLTALIFLGVTGLIVSLAFVYFSAPDLALTQLLVEMVSIILMMLALKHLPPPQMHSSDAQVLHTAQRGRFWWSARLPALVVALASGAGVAWLCYQVLVRPFNSISPFYLQNTISQGGGANAVNVIIVDFRGFDTLGEIAVLGMAGLIVAMLMVGWQNTSNEAHFQAKTPEKPRQSLILSVISSVLFPLATMVAVYFFMRGHNLPGGGFIAGLVFAIGVILQWVAFGREAAIAKLALMPSRWIGGGLFIAGLTGVGSWLVGFPFLTSTTPYFNVPVLGAVPVASAMFFDLGVLLTVIGGTLLALKTMAGFGEPVPTTPQEAA